MTAVGALFAQTRIQLPNLIRPQHQSAAFEQDLIARVQAGQADAFYELVRPYERAVFLSALSLTRNDADAEEVAQEAMLKAFKNIGGFRREAKFSTWLIQIAINEAKMKIRKNRCHLYESIYFCATKLEAFAGRGKNDYQSSHDLEDLMAVVDGRAELVEEIRPGPEDVRAYMATEIRKLLTVREFLDALPGYLLPDQTSQARVSILLERLKQIAAL